MMEKKLGENREENINVQKNTARLWKFLKDTLEYYNEIACPCAFPRFRQIIAIDCSDYGESFYCSETEGFIHHARIFYSFQNLGCGTEIDNELWICKKCGSNFRYGWSGFSIHVRRSFLKLEKKRTKDLGAESEKPIPLFVGLFGHSYPDKSKMIKVSFKEFSHYVRKLKNE